MFRKSDKKSATSKFEETLSKNPAIIHEIIRQFVDQQVIQEDEGDPNKRKANVISFIEDEFKKMFGPGVTVSSLGGNNNLNLSVKYKYDGVEEEFVVQIGAEREPSQTAMKKLNEPSKPWLADVYGNHSFDSGMTTLEMMAEASTKPVGFMRLVEKLPTSLEREVKENKENKEKKVMVGTTKEIEFAKTVGMQLSTIFSTMSVNNVVWTDCKPGNLLMRKNHDGTSQIVIADSKAILPVTEYPRSSNGEIVFDTLLTRDFISREGYKKLMEDPEYHKPAAFKALMEKEYSYQMAVTLYYAATGEMILSTDTQKQFEFNANMFKTPAGEKLKFIIEQLSKPNPDERMSHLDAARLLAVINNEKIYNDVLGKIQNPSPPSSPSIPVQRTSDIHLALALASQKDKNPEKEKKPEDRLRAKSEAAALIRRSSAVIKPSATEKVGQAKETVDKAKDDTKSKSVQFDPDVKEKVGSDKSPTTPRQGNQSSVVADSESRKSFNRPS